MLARKMSSGMEQHGLLQSEYLEDLASQETGDQGQRVTRQTVRCKNIYKLQVCLQQGQAQINKHQSLNIKGWVHVSVSE